MSIYDMRNRIAMLPMLKSELLSLECQLKVCQRNICHVHTKIVDTNTTIEQMKHLDFSNTLLMASNKYEDKLSGALANRMRFQKEYDDALTYLEQLKESMGEVLLDIFDTEQEASTYSECIHQRYLAICSDESHPDAIRLAQIKQERDSIDLAKNVVTGEIRHLAKMNGLCEDVINLLDEAHIIATTTHRRDAKAEAANARVQLMYAAHDSFQVLQATINGFKVQCTHFSQISIPEFNLISPFHQQLKVRTGLKLTDFFSEHTIKDHLSRMKTLKYDLSLLNKDLSLKMDVLEQRHAFNLRMEQEIIVFLHE